MSQQIIKFRIRQDGIVEELVEGVHGSSCEQVTQSIEEKLGDLQFRRQTADTYSSVVEHDHVSVSSQDHHFPGP